MNRTIKLFACTLVLLQIACTQTFREKPPPFSTNDNRPLVHEPLNEPFTRTPKPSRKHTPDAGRVEPSPAVLALLTAAETNRKQGELESAVVAIERALRIQPRNPLLWHRLAELRLQQHKPRLALELAKKSNSLAANDHRLIDQNNKLIANARRHQ